MKFEGHTEAVGAVALMKRKHAYETGNAAGFSAGKGITRGRPGMALGWLLTPGHVVRGPQVETEPSRGGRSSGSSASMGRRMRRRCTW